MAVYVPAARRRRLAALTTALAVFVGLGLGFVVGRSSARGVDDAIAEARDRAGDAATALARLPIEYEQSASGRGGETSAKMIASIRAARTILDDAYAAAPWLGARAKRDVDEAVALVLDDARADVDPAAFETDVDAAADAIDEAFGTKAGRAG